MKIYAWDNYYYLVDRSWQSFDSLQSPLIGDGWPILNANNRLTHPIPPNLGDTGYFVGTGCLTPVFIAFIVFTIQCYPISLAIAGQGLMSLEAWWRLLSCGVLELKELLLCGQADLLKQISSSLPDLCTVS